MSVVSSAQVTCRALPPTVIVVIDREHGRDRQRRPPVGDPVRLLVAAVPEHLRVRPALVEPDHDLRAGTGGLRQLRQRLGEGGGQAGRLTGHEAHRPPVMHG
jgi:hypothetical protein